MKKYAPSTPDATLYRPGDTDYLRELLAAAGLSQRKAAPLLGIDERNIRHKIAGDKPFSYPEQYCLEVLADNARSLRTIHEDSPTYGDHPHGWHQAQHRPVRTADQGKLIIGLDASGNVVACGEVAADPFGAFILGFADLDRPRLTVDRICTYLLAEKP